MVVTEYLLTGSVLHPALSGPELGRPVRQPPARRQPRCGSRPPATVAPADDQPGPAQHAEVGADATGTPARPQRERLRRGRALQGAQQRGAAAADQLLERSRGRGVAEPQVADAGRLVGERRVPGRVDPRPDVPGQDGGDQQQAPAIEVDVSRGQLGGGDRQVAAVPGHGRVEIGERRLAPGRHQPAGPGSRSRSPGTPTSAATTAPAPPARTTAPAPRSRPARPGAPRRTGVRRPARRPGTRAARPTAPARGPWLRAGPARPRSAGAAPRAGEHRSSATPCARAGWRRTAAPGRAPRRPASRSRPIGGARGTDGAAGPRTSPRPARSAARWRTWCGAGRGGRTGTGPAAQPETWIQTIPNRFVRRGIGDALGADRSTHPRRSRT